MKKIILPVVLGVLLAASCAKQKKSEKEVSQEEIKVENAELNEDQLMETEQYAEDTLEDLKTSLGDNISYEATYTSKEAGDIYLLYVNQEDEKLIYLFKNEMINDLFTQKEAWTNGGKYIGAGLDELIAEGEKVTIKSGDKSTVYTEVK